MRQRLVHAAPFLALWWLIRSPLWGRVLANSPDNGLARRNVTMNVVMSAAMLMGIMRHSGEWEHTYCNYYNKKQGFYIFHGLFKMSGVLNLGIRLLRTTQ